MKDDLVRDITAELKRTLMEADCGKGLGLFIETLYRYFPDQFAGIAVYSGGQFKVSFSSDPECLDEIFAGGAEVSGAAPASFILTPDKKSSAKDPLLKILFEKKHTALSVYPVTNETGTIAFLLASVNPDRTILSILDEVYFPFSVKAICYYQDAGLKARFHLSEAMENALPIPFYIWMNRNDRYYLVHYNEAAQHVSEFDLKARLNTAAEEFYAGHQEMLDNIRLCGKSGLRIYQEVSYENPEGDKKWMQVIYTSVENEYVSVITDDVTERKDYEETMRLQRDIAVRMGAAEDYEKAVKELIDRIVDDEEAERGWVTVWENGEKLPAGSYYKNVSQAEAEKCESKMPADTSGGTANASYREVRYNYAPFCHVICFMIFYKEDLLCRICFAANRKGGFSVVFRNRLKIISETVLNVLIRIRTVRALKESDLRFRTLFSSTTDGISFIEESKDGAIRLIDCNPAYAAMSGQTKEQLLRYKDIRKLQVQRPWFETDNPGTDLAGGGVYSWIRKDGKENYIEYRYEKVTLGNTTYFVGIDRDITKEKSYGDEIAVLAKFPSESPNPVLRLNADGTVIYSNKSAELYLSGPNNGYGLFDKKLLNRYAKQVLQTRNNLYIEQSFDGKTFSFIFTPVGESGNIYVYGNDITALKKVQNELDEKQKFYSRVLESSVDGVAVTNALDVVEFVNKAFKDGIALDRSSGRPIDEFFADNPDIGAYYRTARSQNTNVRFESVPLKLDGGVTYYSGWFLPRFEDGKYDGMIWIGQNVSERRKFEDDRLQEEGFRELRVEMWKLAADKSIQTEEELVEKLFKLIGESIRPSKVCLNKIMKNGDTTNVYEWLKAGQTPSPKTTHIPKAVWSKLQDAGNYFQYTPQSMAEFLLPGKIFSPFKKLIENIFISEGIYNIVLFPYKVDGKMEGVISFDWCDGSDKEWKQGEIFTGLDMSRILSMNTSKFRSENALLESERKLRESEAHFRSLLENSSTFVLMRMIVSGASPFDLRIIMVSPHVKELLGVDDLYDLKKWRKNIYPADLFGIYRKYLRSGGSYDYEMEFRINHPGKGLIWIRGMTTAIRDEFGKPRYLNGILSDITKEHLATEELLKNKDYLESVVRKRANELSQTYEQLRESEKKVKAFFDSSMEAFILMDIHFNIQTLNESAKAISSRLFIKQLNIGDNFLKTIPKDKRARMEMNCMNSLKGEEIQIVTNLTQVDNTESWFEMNFTPLREDDKPAGVCVTCWDITERKNAEDALRESEQRFRAVVQDQTEYIVRFDANGSITFVNRAFCKLFDQSEQLLLGRSIFNFFSNEFAMEIQAKMIQKGNAGSGTYVREEEFHLAGGRRVWVSWTYRAITSQTGAIVEFQAVGLDITVKKQSEYQERALIEKLRNIYTELGEFSRIISKDYQGLSLRTLDQYGITERERQVIALVTKGLKNKEIASKIHVSDESVKKYLTHIFEKLHVSNRVELVSFIKDNQIIL